MTNSFKNPLQFFFWSISYFFIYIFLSACLYPINVKTAELIGPKFCVGSHMTPGKVQGCSKLQKFVFKSFWFLLNLKNARKNICKSTNFFVIDLKCTKMLTDRSTSWNVRTLVFYNWFHLLQIANLSVTRYYTSISETHLFWIHNCSFFNLTKIRPPPLLDHEKWQLRRLSPFYACAFLRRYSILLNIFSM